MESRGSRLRVVDLFCGAGGFSLGFRAAGCHVQAAVDHDSAAAETFRRNFQILQPEDPPNVIGGKEADLADLDPVEITNCDKGPDILVGGPPCQGFSLLGRAKLNDLFEEGLREGGHAEDPRNELYLRFLAAGRFWKPRVILMENVIGMLSVNGENVAEQVAHDLARLGYRVCYAVLNAAFYGVPQYRERLFFLGIREDLGISPELPPAMYKADKLPVGYFNSRLAMSEYQQLSLFENVPRYRKTVGHIDYPLPVIRVRDAIEDLPVITEHLSPDSSIPRGDFRILREYQKPPVHPYARLMRDWPGLDAGALDDHVIRRTPRDHETFRAMAPGDDYPRALEHARARFQTELARLSERNEAPSPGTDAFSRLEAQFVPPYKEDTFSTRWQKLIPEEPSWTVPAHLAHDTYSHIHYDSEQARSISVREAARIQSFPDGYKFVGNMGTCFRQIGNAVPPLLAWAIAAHVMNLLGEEFLPPPLFDSITSPVQG